MYFMAHHTAIDCHERRGQPGYLFLIGDEIPYPVVRRDEVESVIGDRLQADIPTEDVLAELRRRYDVYFILPKMTHHWNSREVRGRWGELLGQNVLRLEDPAGICELIDDLLDLTRIARGKLELQVGAMDFHSVLRQSIEICRPDSEAKELTVQLSLRAKQTRTEGDAIRLQQAIWNLLRNAVKFTPRGGSIMIRTSNDQQDHIVLEVQDTGIGFDAHTRNRLFEAFEQGNRSITQRFGGLGLGLAITQSIVESHGGSVRGESKGPGRGATFILQLPLRPASPDTGTWVPHSASPVAERIGLRLLLVEDHVDTRRSMEFLLARHRHVVKSAASAREALELAANNKFDLVISDLGLPDQNGLELMKQLRDRFGLKGIGVSGYGMEEDIAKSRAAGFVCHLTKPISMDRLRQAIADSAKA